MGKIVYEVDKSDIKKYGLDGCIQRKEYTVWTQERIRGAFNFGHGTLKDFLRYQRDNGRYAVFMDGEEYND